MATTTTISGLFSVGPEAPRAPRGSVGLYHLAWEVPTIEDLAAAAGILSEAGALGGASDHGVSKSLYGHDPDGNEFEIMWRVPRESWGDYEEHGAVMPLDIDAEVRRWGSAELGVAHAGEAAVSDGFPADGMELTHILVVADVDRARSFYRDVLGAEVYREYGGTSCVLRAFGTWLLLVTGGGPTADKPTVTFAPPTDPDVVGHAMTIRVPDCRGGLRDPARSRRGVPDRAGRVDWEVRAFFRDPDGHLIEISEAKTRS